MADTDLLDTARSELLEKILPSLDGANRYSALMISKAIAVHQRASMAGPEPLTHDLAPLCAQIRAGHFDPGKTGRARLLQQLAAQTDHLLAISNPKFLAARDDQCED